MTVEDRSYFYKAEVKHCAELLYTMAKVNKPSERTTFSDMRGNFSGYDEEVCQNVANFGAGVYFGFGKNYKKLVRKFLREQAARLTAEAAAIRGYLVHGEDN